jgi:hypothetical protein
MNGYWPIGFDTELDSFLSRLSEIQTLQPGNAGRPALLDSLEGEYQQWISARRKLTTPKEVASKNRLAWLDRSNAIQKTIADYENANLERDPDYSRLCFLREVLRAGSDLGYDHSLRVERWGKYNGIRFTRFGSPQLIINDIWITPWDYALIYTAPAEFTGRTEEIEAARERGDLVETTRVDCTTLLDLFKVPKRIMGAEETVESVLLVMESLSC